MPKIDPFVSQQELDTRLLNLFLLQEEKGNDKGFLKVNLLGGSNMFVAVSPAKYFPVYINITNNWFRLGAYSSEELETNPKIKMEFPATAYVNYQDLKTIFHETKRLKQEYGKLNQALVSTYHDQIPRNYSITVAHIREIFGSCTNKLWKQKPQPLLHELAKLTKKEIQQEPEISQVPEIMKVLEVTKVPKIPKNPPRKAKFIEVKEDKEVKLTEQQLNQPINLEPEKRSKKEIEEELEDLDIQMRLLKLEKEQILLQQRINKLKRA